MLNARTPDFLAPLTSGLSSTIGDPVSLTYSRSGAAWYIDPDDEIIKQVATNTPAHSSKGVLIEPSRTNYVTSYNAPSLGQNSGYSVSGGIVKQTITDTENALDAAGLGNITNGAFHRIENNTGSQQTITFTGAPGHVNSVACQIWARVTGLVTMRYGGTSTSIDYPMPESSVFTRYRLENIGAIREQDGTEDPLATTDVFKLEIADGATIDFVLQSTESSLDLKAVTVANASDQITLSLHGFIDGDQVAFQAEAMPGGLSANTRYWVVNSFVNTFKVAATKGGSAINITTDGTAVQVYPISQGMGCSSPIVVAGSIATRDAPTTLVLSVGATNLPLIDYVMAFDVTPNSEHQTQRCFLYDNYDTSNNNLRILGPSWLRFEKDGVENDYVGFNKFRNGVTQTLALLHSRQHGVELFSNGIGCMTRHKYDLLDAGLQTHSARLGRGVDGIDRIFNGWIRNFRIYHGNVESSDVADMTRNYFPGEVLGVITGVPVYDPTTQGRVWALRLSLNDEPSSSVPDRFRYLAYSDDDGSSWTDILDLGASKTQIPTLFMDSSGNHYFSTANTGLQRIDATTRAITTVISDFNDAGLGGLGLTWSVLNWSWGEAEDGTLYFSPYCTSAGVANGQYVWTSPVGGTSWSDIDTLVTDYVNGRHVHALTYDTYRDRLWVTIGDTDRVTGYSEDGLGTSLVSVSSPRPGETGVTVTSEGAIFGTDASGSDENSTNGVTYSDGASTFLGWLPGGVFEDTHLYQVRSRGKDELWVLGFAEATNETDKFTYIAQLVKRSGLHSVWGIQQWITLAHRFVNGLNSYAFAGEANLIIPEWSQHVFVQIKVDNTNRDIHHLRNEESSGNPATNNRILRIPVVPKSFNSDGYPNPLRATYRRSLSEVRPNA